MNFLTNWAGLTAYRVLLVSICIVSLMIWTETIQILGIIFGFCLPGIFNHLFNEQYDERREKFYIPGRFLAPYQLFKFIWNGFRSQKG